ncbi:hypothetical protein D1871_15525 [Nakamurella silvestris]|nr:hypothetical protein D1871_15525 [Nakamurella silvestris]
MTNPGDHPQNPDPYGYQGQTGQTPQGSPAPGQPTYDPSGYPQQASEQPGYGQQYGAHAQPQPQYGQPQYGQQPYGPANPYGAPMPGYPGGVNSPVTRTPRPPTVSAAVIIYLLTAAAYVVTFVQLVNNDTFKAMALEAANSPDVDLNGQDPETVVSALKFVFIGVGVVLALLLVFFALKMGAGRNWSRIVLTVISAFSILGAFGDTTSQSVTINNTVFEVSTAAGLRYTVAAVAAFALLLMWLRPSNDFFSARKLEKMRRAIARS